MWQAIDTAPKDGTKILVLSIPQEFELVDGTITTIPPHEFVAWWYPEGDSWVDGKLVETGLWFCEIGGWLRPDEVTHWKEL